MRKKLTEQSTEFFFPKWNSHNKNIERLHVSYSNYDYNLFSARIVVFFNRKYQTHLFLFSAFLIATRRNYVGQHSDPRCIYVPPSSGKTFYAFRIAYARCGTKPDLNGQFYENTVRVQVFVVVA